MKKLLPIFFSIPLLISCSQASSLQEHRYENKKYLVFATTELQSLELALNNKQGDVLGSFHSWSKQLKSCQNLSFAMNAGMYHPSYQPVGLYIENSKQLNAINVESGEGNFFMQPNGILAWNHKEALVTTTENWRKIKFDAQYATQSGPMLVADGKIMDQFIKESDSKKIRNGVGIKNGKLFFVISQQRVNFYEFAAFFKEKLNVEQALYLDGSISSIHAPQINRYDRAFKLGPMLGFIEHQSNCH